MIQARRCHVSHMVCAVLCSEGDSSAGGSPGLAPGPAGVMCYTHTLSPSSSVRAEGAGVSECVCEVVAQRQERLPPSPGCSYTESHRSPFRWRPAAWSLLFEASSGLYASVGLSIGFVIVPVPEIR